MEDLLVHVLLPKGESLSYEVPHGENVEYLINLMKNDEKVKIPKNKNVVIIYRGKILSPTDVLSSFDKMTEFSVHAFFKIDPNYRPEEETAESEHISEPRGFDRLVRMNYSPEQIQNIRINFHTVHNSLNESPEARIDLEEEWFPVIFNQQDYSEILRQVDANPADINPQDSPANNNANNNNVRPEQPLLNNNNDEEYEMDAIIGEKPWLVSAIGFVFGLVLGLSPMIFILIFCRPKWFRIGLVFGVVFHILIVYSFFE